ncbi:MAG: HDOD domain-containing protein [Armatimonadetes bacterium]|nr:HDOD domain-containing protein [Armatimonadota bacterium]
MSAISQSVVENSKQAYSAAYVARQPIIDAAGQVSAYELLYRSGRVGSAGEVGLAESSTMIVDTIGAFGLNSLVGTKPAFINISEELLLSGVIDMLPVDRVVLEILETVDASPEVLEAVKSLKRQGYRLAIDDYTGQPQLGPFLPLVSVVKFEVKDADPKFYAPIVRQLKSKGKALLAEKVETYEEFQRWKKLGFELFQGYFYAKPEVVEGRGAVCRHEVLIALISRLSDPAVSLEEIDRIISGDPGLSFRLLKMLRSAAMGLDSRLHSLREAVSFIGIRKTGALATILSMSSIPKKSPELLQTVLIRANFCELLARDLKLFAPDAYFTLGLFSLLDAMLDMPISEIVSQLPLSEDVIEALVNPVAESDLARVLRFVKGWERGSPTALEGSGIMESSPQFHYVEALRRAQELMSSCETSH